MIRSKRFIAFVLFCAILAAFIPSGIRVDNLVHAESDIDVQASAECVDVDLVDPIEMTRTDLSPLNVRKFTQEEIAGKVIVYTGNFYLMDTYVRENEDVNEFKVEVNGTEHVILDKMSNSGNEIPVPGYILSIPTSLSRYNNLKVGDKIQLNADEEIDFPTASVDNPTKRKRIIIHHENSALSTGYWMLNGNIYFGPEFGSNIPERAYCADVDFSMITSGDDAGKFSVSGFRGIDATGKMIPGGAKIPDPGFIITAWLGTTPDDKSTKNTRVACGMLFENEAFSLGDVVILNGKDYFGLDYQIKENYDYFDPTPEDNPLGAPFPEYRGPCQLNIYSKSAMDGGNELRTNIYGFEAAVDKDGIVTAVGVNAIDIPEGGFIVSGQGQIGWIDWVRNNFKVGARVEIDKANKIIKLTNTMESVLNLIKNKATVLRSNITNYETRMYDIDTSVLYPMVEEYEKLTAAALGYAKEIESGALTKDEVLQKKVLIKQILSKCQVVENEVIINSVESRAIGGRGVWHCADVNSTEPDIEGIRRTLSIVADAGMNVLFVEAAAEGFAYFKSDMMNYSPRFVSRKYGDYEDYLSAFLGEAEKYDLDIIISVPIFLVGSGTEYSRMNGSLAEEHPEWLVCNRKGDLGQPKLPMWRFMDPANTEYRQYILEFCEEIYRKFPTVKGLNLDYIRYDGTDATTGIDMGYTMTAMKAFLNAEGKVLPGLSENDEVLLRKNFLEYVDNNQIARKRWNEFRRDQVSSAVKEISNMSRNFDKSKLITTATGPDFDNARDVLFQDWFKWVKNGWVDVCTPMVYLTEAEAVKTNTKQALNAINNMCYNYVGIGSYQGWAPIDYIQQIEAVHSTVAAGFSIFSTAEVCKQSDAVEAIKKGVAKNKAVRPTDSVDKVLDACFKDILSKAERLYIPKKGMMQSQYDLLKAEFERIQAMKFDSSYDLLQINNAINAIIESPEKYVKNFAQQRLKDNLQLLASVMDIKLSRSMLLNGEWDPSESEIRPMPNGGKTEEIEPGKPLTPNKKENTKKGCKSWIGTQSIPVFFFLSLIGVCFMIVKQKRRKL